MAPTSPAPLMLQRKRPALTRSCAAPRFISIAARLDPAVVFIIVFNYFLRYALQSDVSKSAPWLSFVGWLSSGGNGYAPLCCRALEPLVKSQGSLLVAAFDGHDGNGVVRIMPFYHR